jgi:hypothetical protein
VDLDTREEAAELRNQAGRQRPAPPVEAVCQAMHHNGMEARIAQQDLQDASRSGILAIDGCDLLSDSPEHENLRAASVSIPGSPEPEYLSVGL